jgi:hypothetical protein
MTTFVGYDYLVTRKNKKNGGKMKMNGVREFWGKSSHYLVPNGMSTHDRGQNGAKIAPGGKIPELRLCV